MFNINDYRLWLKSVLKQRQGANKAYSLRAFARDLGFTPARISQILQGKQGLGLKSAKKICYALKLSEEETQFFCLLVEARDSRSKLKRQEASQSLKMFRAQKRAQEFTSVDDQKFSPISDWYYFAILELLTLPGVQFNAEWISQKLGINKNEVSEAIERLSAANLVTLKDGKWIVDPIKLSTAYNLPSLAVRKFHGQILGKAEIALQEQEVLKRDISTLVLKMDSSSLPRFKQMLNDFRREFDAEVTAHLQANPTKADSVYALSIALFNLTTDESENKDSQ